MHRKRPSESIRPDAESERAGPTAPPPVAGLTVSLCGLLLVFDLVWFGLVFCSVSCISSHRTMLATSHRVIQHECCYKDLWGG